MLKGLGLGTMALKVQALMLRAEASALALITSDSNV